MIIITEKPMRSVEISGWYIDEYKDKSDKKIFKLVGVLSPKGRGRIVSRDSSVVKDVYTDEESIIIYRSENLNNVISCKRIIDLVAAKGGSVFSIVTFYEWLKEQEKQEAVTVNEN